MIDVHCHLEQKEYDGMLDELIEKWKKELKFVISSCAHFEDLDKTLAIYEKYNPFVKICIGLHPEFIKEIKEQDTKQVIEFIKQNKKEIVAVGEIGLDYYWIKEEEWREKQKEMFRRFIRLAKELNLPVVVHSRDAGEDTIRVLEEEGMQNKKVLMHLLTDYENLQSVIKNNWFISIGPNIVKSKERRKIVRDMSLNRIMLETDSPWFKQEGQEFGEPINVRVACEKIAEIKNLEKSYVEEQTDETAKEFFRL